MKTKKTISIRKIIIIALAVVTIFVGVMNEVNARSIISADAFRPCSDMYEDDFEATICGKLNATQMLQQSHSYHTNAYICFALAEILIVAAILNKK